MRKASVGELRINTSELLREASEGGVIVIERRDRPVAELRPVTAVGPLSPAPKDLIFKSMEDLWASLPQVADSGTMIGEDRNR